MKRILYAILVLAACNSALAESPNVPKFVNGASGVFDMSDGVEVPRQRTNIKVPPSFLAGQSASPGGELYGKDLFGTVLRFSPKLKGPLISTELYGTGLAGGFWNDANTQGDTKLRACICSSVHDLTIDGRAEIRAYPWGFPNDPHGQNVEQRADGLCIEGNGFRGERIRLFQIPGTALILKGGIGGQGGAFGIYDAPFSTLDDINILSVINGMFVQSGDAKLRNIWIANCVKDGLTINGPCVLDTTHIQGADRAVVIKMTSELHHCYHESARIGTHLLGGSDGTVIDGLNIGPGTCWGRGVKVESNGNAIINLMGSVRAYSKEHPDVAGVEVVPSVHQRVEGRLGVGAGSVGVIWNPSRSQLDLHGGWIGQQTATFVSIRSAVTGDDVHIKGKGDGGVVLDLSASGLDKANGCGNHFTIDWAGTSTPVIYPGGGTTFNLSPGTEVEINGQVQR